jgi:hypothetical protein
MINECEQVMIQLTTERGNRSTQRKPGQLEFLSTTNPIGPDLGTEPGLAALGSPRLTV